MRLAQRTGERLIVADGEDSLVIMSIDQYEELVGADEFYLGDLPEEFFVPEDKETPPLEMYEPKAKDEDIPGPEGGMQHPAAPIEIEEQPTMPNVTSAVPESITQEEEEEERFYLEPID